MKRAMLARILALLIGVAVVMSILAACGGAAQPTEAPDAGAPPALTAPVIDAAGLIDERCSSCHPATRTKTAQKTQAEWQQTVDRMIAKGAQLTDAEKASLVEYLARTYGK